MNIKLIVCLFVLVAVTSANKKLNKAVDKVLTVKDSIDPAKAGDLQECLDKLCRMLEALKEGGEMEM